MCHVEICRQIETHSCHIGGTLYRFKVRTAVERAAAVTLPAHAVLEVEAFKDDGNGVSVARLRVTAPTLELARIPSLLTRALEHWLLVTTETAGSIH
jgi:hypothetical protein